MGKISYLRVCEDRLVQLPDSQLGAALRARRAGKSGLLYNNLTPNPSLVLAPFQSAVDGLDDDRQVRISFVMYNSVVVILDSITV